MPLLASYATLALCCGAASECCRCRCWQLLRLPCTAFLFWGLLPSILPALPARSTPVPCCHQLDLFDVLCLQCPLTTHTPLAPPTHTLFVCRFRIYFNRLHLPQVLKRPPPLQLGGLRQLWSWLVPVFTVSDKELLETAGLDALVGWWLVTGRWG